MKNPEELKTMTKSKKYKTQQKSLKARDNPTILKEYSPLVHLGKTQHKELPNASVCDIIIEGKSPTFKNQEAKFRIKKDLSCNSKNIIYVIECNKCKEIYI